MKKLISFVSLEFISLFILHSIAFAQAPTPVTCPDGQVASDLGCISQDPVGFVQQFYGWGLGLIGMVAVIFMIIGGYYLMTSQGDPSRLAKAKSYIIYSIAGLLLAVFGFIFVQFIAGSLLKIPGFS